MRFWILLIFIVLISGGDCIFMFVRYVIVMMVELLMELGDCVMLLFIVLIDCNM